MSHIDEDGRRFLDKEIDALITKLKDVSIEGDSKNGYIKYCVTRIVWEVTGLDKEEKDWKYNDAIGILECAKLELYRQCAYYEDKNINQYRHYQRKRH